MVEQRTLHVCELRQGEPGEMRVLHTSEELRVLCSITLQYQNKLHKAGAAVHGIFVCAMYEYVTSHTPVSPIAYIPKRAAS